MCLLGFLLFLLLVFHVWSMVCWWIALFVRARLQTLFSFFLFFKFFCFSELPLLLSIVCRSFVWLTNFCFLVENLLFFLFFLLILNQHSSLCIVILLVEKAAAAITKSWLAERKQRHCCAKVLKLKCCWFGWAPLLLCCFTGQTWEEREIGMRSTLTDWITN